MFSIARSSMRFQTAAIAFFQILFLFLTILSPGRDHDPGKAFLPDRSDREISIIGDSATGTSGKKAIVIDGSILGVDGKSSPSLMQDLPEGKAWWKGLEDAYTNCRVLKGILEKRRDHLSDAVDPAGFARKCEKEEYREIYEGLNREIRRLRFTLGFEENMPVLSDLHVCLALIQMEVLNHPMAEELLDLSLKLEPGNPIALAVLGDVLAEEGRFDAAFEQITPLLSSPYFPVRIHALQSRIHQRNNRIERAIYHWNRVLERIDPGPDEIFRLRFLESERLVQERFLTYSTAHYVVRYEPVFRKERENLIGPILTMVDEARWRLDRRFGVSPGDKTMVLIYSDQTLKTMLGGRMEQLEAFFNLEDGKLRISIRDDWRDSLQKLRPVIFHEYVHRLVHYMTRGRMRIRWFHEGMATYYEREVTGLDRFVNIARPSKGKITGWNDLLKEEINVQGYLQSRRIIEFIVERYGEKKLFLFLNELGEGKSMDDASVEAFGISFAKLEKRVIEEIR